MSRKIQWSPVAAEHLEYWKKTDRKKYDRILQLCESMCMTPTRGLGKPEALKYEKSGY